MESDNAVIALSWRRSFEVGNPSKQKQKENPFPWRFACILVAGWEGQIHILNFIYSVLRVDCLRTSFHQQRNTSPPCFSR
jgi:hypothetical protein